MNDIKLPIYEAIDNIVNNRVSSLKTDQTVVATIKAKIQNDNSFNYEVEYKKVNYLIKNVIENYSINQKVLLLISQDDSKSIIGKYHSDQSEILKTKYFKSIDKVVTTGNVYIAEEQLNLVAGTDYEDIKTISNIVLNDYGVGDLKYLVIAADVFTHNIKTNYSDNCFYGIEAKFYDSNDNVIGICTLDSRNFQGNPFKFFTNFSQFNVFDISEIVSKLQNSNTINGIEKNNTINIPKIIINLYQSEILPENSDDGAGTISFQNLKIYAGVSAEETSLSKETLRIISNPINYNNIEDSTINFSALYIKEKENYPKSYDSYFDSANDGVIGWYRFTDGIEDGGLGPGWAKITDEDLNNSFNPSISNANDKEYELNSGEAKSSLPNKNKGQERFKAALHFPDGRIIQSNTLVLDRVNSNGELVPTPEGSSMIDLAYVNDDHNGKYYLYGYDYSLLDSFQSTKIRSLQVNYLDSSLVWPLSTIVQWYIPLKATMIQSPILESGDWDEDYASNTIAEPYIDSTNDYVVISRSIDNTIESRQQNFKIKPIYSENANNNTIKCIIISPDGQVTAQAQKTLEFSSYASNGTDYNFTITSDQSCLYLPEAIYYEEVDLRWAIEEKAMTLPIKSTFQIVPQSFKIQPAASPITDLPSENGIGILYSENRRWGTINYNTGAIEIETLIPNPDFFSSCQIYYSVQKPEEQNYLKVNASLTNSQGEVIDFDFANVSWEILNQNENINDFLVSLEGETNSEVEIYINPEYFPLYLDSSKSNIYYRQKGLEDPNGWIQFVPGQDINNEEYEYKAKISKPSGSYCYIRPKANFSENNYNVLVATLNNWTLENGMTVNLKAFLPIAISNSSNISYIQGPTRFIYDQDGTKPIYSKDPYALLTSKELDGQNINEDIEISIITKPDNTSGLDIKNNTISVWAIAPTVFPQATLIFTNSEKKVLFQQPLIFYRNQYSSEFVNDWGGEQVIDNNGNFILSKLIGAGKKDTNNTFTGVFMGAVGGIQNAAITGLYGYQKGELRFKFTEQGDGYLGTGDDNKIEFTRGSLNIQSKKFKLKTENGLYLSDQSNSEGYLFTLGKNNKKLTVDNNGNLNISGITADSLVIKNTLGNTLFKAANNTVEMAGWQVSPTEIYKKHEKNGEYSKLKYLQPKANEDTKGYIVLSGLRPTSSTGFSIKYSLGNTTKISGVDGEYGCIFGTRKHSY